jgi:ComF family protein
MIIVAFRSAKAAETLAAFAERKATIQPGCSFRSRVYDAHMSGWLHPLRRSISALASLGRDLLLPPHCPCCDRQLFGENSDGRLCADCLTRLGPQHWHGCRRCGAEVPPSGLPPERCPLCRNTPLKFDAAVPLGSYHTGLSDVVLRMKRPAHHALSIAMGRLLICRRREQLLEHRADLVVPIPMFWTRRLGRGVNSPDLLARCLAESLEIPIRRDILVRRRNTLPQANLPPSRRFDNVRDAFRVRRPAPAQNARILLVDDVLTTGATSSEAAKVLKQAGAAYVVVAVIARAQGR